MRNLNKNTKTSISSNNNRRLSQIPIGTYTDESTAMLPLANTLITGRSGSGKSVILDDIVNHYLSASGKNSPTISERGLVKFYGIDPKGGLMAYEKKGLFTRFATTDTLSVIAPLNKEMRGRSAVLNGRYKPSEKHPIALLFIDDCDPFNSKDEELNRLSHELLLFGPSVGFYMFITTQRTNLFANIEGFGNKIATEVLEPEWLKDLFGLSELTAEMTTINAKQWTAHISTPLRPDLELISRGEKSEPVPAQLPLLSRVQ